MSVGTRLLVLVFPALLPPTDSSDRDFYEVLGLPTSASEDDIRKAYRQKSLALHPDKVAQRGEENPEVAAAEYEFVQQAYTVLNDSEQRQLYQAVGRSPCRFRFLTTGGLTNPMSLFENLSRASVADKSRIIVLLSTLLFIFVLLQPILIAARVDAQADFQACVNRMESTVASCRDIAMIEAKWTVVLIPCWILYSLIIAFWMAMAYLAPKEARVRVVFSLAEHLFWFIAFIVLARAWDKQSNKVNWHGVSVPFYLALIVRILGNVVSVRSLRSEQNKMVSPTFVRQQEGENISEERLAELEEMYVVVSPDDEAVVLTLRVMNSDPDAPALTDEEIEEIRVQSSPEFQSSDRVIKSLHNSTASTILIMIPFVSLVAARLEDQITASWWVVFLPIWLYFAVKVFLSLFVCFCGSMPTRQEAMAMMVHANTEAATTQEEIAAAQLSEQEAHQKQQDDKPSSLEPSNTPSSGDISASPSQGGENTANHTTATTTSHDRETSSANMFRAAESKSDVNLDHIANVPQAQGTNGNAKDGEAADFSFEPTEAEIEAQANARLSCCTVIFQIIITTLLVGKLDQEYETEDPSPSYSAFIVLLPIFFITAVLICCCSVLIYGSSEAPNTDANFDSHQEDEEQPVSHPGNNDDIVIPAPPEDEPPPTILDAIDNHQHEVSPIKTVDPVPTAAPVDMSELD